MARILDVSLVPGSFRHQGHESVVPFGVFVKCLIWLLAIAVMRILHWVCYVAYAAGFASGNFVGMFLEEKLAIGHEMIRVITRKDATNLIGDLRAKGYGVTSVKAEGIEGEVAVIYIIARRSMIQAVLNDINAFNPRAFYTVESIKYVNKEIFHRAEEERHRSWLSGRIKRNGR